MAEWLNQTHLNTKHLEKRTDIVPPANTVSPENPKTTAKERGTANFKVAFMKAGALLNSFGPGEPVQIRAEIFHPPTLHDDQSGYSSHLVENTKVFSIVDLTEKELQEGYSGQDDTDPQTANIAKDEEEEQSQNEFVAIKRNYISSPIHPERSKEIITITRFYNQVREYITLTDEGVGTFMPYYPLQYGEIPDNYEERSQSLLKTMQQLEEFLTGESGNKSVVFFEVV